MKLTCNFRSPDKSFDSSMLKMGEMMEIDDEDNPTDKGSIGIKTYDGIISLNDPGISWELSAKLRGRKLFPGESVTLTQE